MQNSKANPLDLSQSQFGWSTTQEMSGRRCWILTNMLVCLECHESSPRASQHLFISPLQVVIWRADWVVCVGIGLFWCLPGKPIGESPNLVLVINDTKLLVSCVKCFELGISNTYDEGVCGKEWWPQDHKEMVHGHEMTIMVEMHMKWWSWWSSMRR
jgi:hypothetical protein